MFRLDCKSGERIIYSMLKKYHLPNSFSEHAAPTTSTLLSFVYKTVCRCCQNLLFLLTIFVFLQLHYNSILLNEGPLSFQKCNNRSRETKPNGYKDITVRLDECERTQTVYVRIIVKEDKALLFNSA